MSRQDSFRPAQHNPRHWSMPLADVKNLVFSHLYEVDAAVPCPYCCKMMADMLHCNTRRCAWSGGVRSKTFFLLSRCVEMTYIVHHSTVQYPVSVARTVLSRMLCYEKVFAHGSNLGETAVVVGSFCERWRPLSIWWRVEVGKLYQMMKNLIDQVTP